MGEVGGIEVHADPQPLGPVDPALKMARFQGVAFHRLAAVLQIDGMEIEAMLAGDHAVGQFGIGPQLGGGAGAARIVAGGHDAAAAEAAAVLEAPHVVALPTMHGDRHAFQAFEDFVGGHAELRISLPGRLIGTFNHCRLHVESPCIVVGSRCRRRDSPRNLARRQTVLILASGGGKSQGVGCNLSF